jgi:hypothetical protein
VHVGDEERRHAPLMLRESANYIEFRRSPATLSDFYSVKTGPRLSSKTDDVRHAPTAPGRPCYD